jgi:WD40 repeat protein
VTGFADRAVEVLCDNGPAAAVADQHLGWTGPASHERWTSASGLLVGDRLVLTAAHALTPDGSVTVRGVDKVERSAVLLLHGDARADLALLELAEPWPGRPPLRFGAVDRDAAGLVRGCRAIGYPRFQEILTPQGRTFRDTAQLDGDIPTGDQRVSGLLTLRVTSTPRPLPPHEEALGRSQWSGVSGTVVVTGPEGAEIVLGVVTEHQPRAGESALTVTPITHIDRLPNARLWWRELGSTPETLVKVPERSRRAAYRATIAEIAARTPHLQDRTADVAALRAFATSSSGYRRLVGAPWAGKTALAARLAADPPPDVDCVAYLLQRRALDASGARFLAAVCGQLADLLGEPPPAEPDEHAFADLWARAADRAYRLDRHLLLIVDGLDEDLLPAGQRSVASLLPARTPERAHVLVTGRKTALPDDVDPDHPLWGLPPEELTQVVSAQRVEQRAETELRTLVEDPATRALLGVLTAAAGPLTADELAEIGGWDAFDVEAALTQRFAGVLDGDIAGGWRFAHQTLLDTCRDTIFGPKRLEPSVAKIDEWARGWAARGWPQQTPRHLFAHRPWALLARGGDADPVLTDPRWLSTAIEALGVDAVLPMLRTAAATSASVREALRVVEIEAPALRSPGTRPAQQLCLAAAYAGLYDEAWQRAATQDGPSLVAVRTTGRASRSLTRTVDSGSHQVWAAAFVTGTGLLTGDDDGRVRLWDLDGGGHREVGRHSSGVKAAAVSPAGDIVVTSAADHTVRIWRLGADGFSVEDPPFISGIGQVWAVAFMPDGRRIVTGGQDRTIRIWDLDTGVPTVIGQHDDQVRAVAVSPDGSMIVSGGRDETVRLWWPDQGTGSVLGRLDRWVEAVAITADGRHVVAGSYIGQVHVWPLDGGPGRDLGRHAGQVWTVTTTPDSRQVISGGGDGQVLAWPLHGGEGRLLGTHRQPVRCVTVSPDGGRAASSAADGLVHVWNLHAAGAQRNEAPWTSVGVSPDGTRLAAGRPTGGVQTWDDGQPWQAVFEQPVRAVAVSSVGYAWLLDGGGVAWTSSLGTETYVTPFSSQPGAVLLAASPNGDYLVAAGGPAGVTSWRRDRGFVPGRLTWIERPDAGPEVTAVAVHDDGTVVTGHLSGSLRILRTDGSLVKVHPGEDPIWAVAVNEGHAASGDKAGRLRLWDLASGSSWLLAEIGTAVTGVAFLRGGQLLLTASDDGLRMWSRREERLLAHVRTEPLRALAAGRNRAATISAELGLTEWALG